MEDLIKQLLVQIVDGIEKFANIAQQVLYSVSQFMVKYDSPELTLTIECVICFLIMMACLLIQEDQRLNLTHFKICFYIYTSAALYIIVTSAVYIAIINTLMLLPIAFLIMILAIGLIMKQKRSKRIQLKLPFPPRRINCEAFNWNNNPSILKKPNIW